MTLSKLNWLSLLLALSICGLAAWYAPSLPDPVPSHWNAYGEVDGWTAKPWGVWIVPFISSTVALILLALPSLIPAQFSRTSTRTRYDRVVLAVMTFMIVFAVAGWESAQGEFALEADRLAAPLAAPE